ncbi:M23 family metallopeptidase [Flaviaesturariibacter amylovorans]|uniref:M23 family metallopeptidase n=1 Tax=Flaviaesturariibacter amylovorans TaxID=1084520 RepID=A0ABP8H043_9BACT
MKNWSLLTLIAVAVASLSFSTAPAKTPAKKKRSVAAASRTVVFPVAGKSRILDKWGASRGGGVRRHKGIDIHARKGTPVVALADGRIVERAHTPIGGKTLWLKSATHPWTAYYAHLDKQYVTEGQYVRKGQVIGTVGNTGNARTTPPHLHFGVARGKSWVNPLPFVKNAPKVAAKTSTKKKATAKRSTRGRKARR